MLQANILENSFRTIVCQKIRKPRHVSLVLSAITKFNGFKAKFTLWLIILIITLIPNSQKQSSMANHLDQRPFTAIIFLRPTRNQEAFFDQEKLARNGFSTVTLPISLCGNVLRGSVSDPSYTLQEQTMPVKGSATYQ
jgi:hypothetical protein